MSYKPLKACNGLSRFPSWKRIWIWAAHEGHLNRKHVQSLLQRLNTLLRGHIDRIRGYSQRMSKGCHGLSNHQLIISYLFGYGVGYLTVHVNHMSHLSHSKPTMTFTWNVGPQPTHLFSKVLFHRNCPGTGWWLFSQGSRWWSSSHFASCWSFSSKPVIPPPVWLLELCTVASKPPWTSWTSDKLSWSLLFNAWKIWK